MKLKLDLSQFDKKKLFNFRLLIMSVIFIATVLGSYLVVIIMDQQKQEKKSELKVQQERQVLLKPTAQVVSEEELWRDSVETKVKNQEAHISKKIEDILNELEGVKNKKPEVQNDNSLSKKVANLSKEIAELKANQHLKISESPHAKNNNISQYNLSLENSQNSEDYKPIKTVDNYIPAGSFAKAIILSGVDAATSLIASSDPDPVLIRITDHGTLPRRFKSDLKDCHIIGAAFGDLSSERAKIRLEKLSCTEIATAEIVETEVAGYVAGEDGRAGLRGEVVSTEGKLLGNSFIAGILSGLSNNFNSATAFNPSTLIQQQKEPSTKDRFTDSFASGASSSMDRLAKYYIDRAESLQPIVQVGAGRNVDVIFTEGVFFGTSQLKKAIAKKRDEKIRDDTSGESNPLIQPIN